MALDTRGLASGFTQGFGLIDRHIAREDQSERADRRLDMQEETFEMQKAKAQRDENKERATFVFGKIANNMPLADEEMQWLQDNPNYLAALNPEADQALEVAQRVIDPDDPLSINDEEGLYAMNTLFEPMINRGKGGQKRVVAGLPGRTRGTMAFELDVAGEDGTPYRAPMTRNRGVAGEDDAVLEVPVEDLVNTAQGYRVLRNVINTNGSSQNAAKLYGLLTGKTPERTKGVTVNDRLVNPYTGEVMGDYRDPNGGDADWARLNNGDLYNKRTGEVRRGVGSQSGSAGQAPADVKTAEWMMQVGLAETPDQAWSLLNESKSDPARFVATYVDQEMKAQENAGLYPGDEGYRSTDDMRQSALQALQAIRSQTRGLGGRSQQGGTSQPAGLEMRDSSVQVLPEDGSAVPAPDGGMQGRVNRGGQAAGLQTQRPQQPQQPQQQAPAAAVEYLRNNPQLADQFRAKYGYLPEGF